MKFSKINNDTSFTSIPILLGLLILLYFLPLESVAQTSPTSNKGHTSNRNQSRKRIKVRDQSSSRVAQSHSKKRKSYIRPQLSNKFSWFAKWNRKRITVASRQKGHAWKGDITGRKINTTDTKKARSGRAKKKQNYFLNENASRSLRTRSESFQRAQSEHNQNTQNHRKTPSRSSTPTKWNVGWYAKWNRKRIAVASRQEERSWKGDITGRKMKIENWEARMKRRGKSVVSYKKHHSSVIDEHPNSKRHPVVLKPLKRTVAMKPLKRNIKHTKYFSHSIQTSRPQKKVNVNNVKGTMVIKASVPGGGEIGKFVGNTRVKRLKRNPNSNRNSIMAKMPTRGIEKYAQYAGNIRVARTRRNAMGTYSVSLHSAPNLAAERFRGNARARKLNDPRLHPDSHFAHGLTSNVKGGRTILVSLKLFWEKLFNKNGTQPPHLKNKLKKPHYDDREKNLWYR